MKASVKIMLSYDYNHFEICLGTDDEQNLSAKEVNELRKTAQRLADHAVKQYQTAKEKEKGRLNLSYERNRLEEEVDKIKDIPKKKWTAEQKAKVKALEDEEYWNQHNYDYNDDEEMDY
jgi:ATP-dependent Clp protease ATP-binding subunit ClpA